MVDNCDCPPEAQFIYVGRAVMLRNRLQVHTFGNRHHTPSPWIDEFQDNPHNHMIWISAWYVPKNELLIAEATLIDLLKPVRNCKDFGYTPPHAWQFRLPDVDPINPCDLEPDPRHRPISVRPDVRNEPAIYAWVYDPRAEKEALEGLLGHLTPPPKQPL